MVFWPTIFDCSSFFLFFFWKDSKQLLPYFCAKSYTAILRCAEREGSKRDVFAALSERTLLSPDRNVVRIGQREQMFSVENFVNFVFSWANKYLYQWYLGRCVDVKIYFRWSVLKWIGLSYYWIKSFQFFQLYMFLIN